MLILLLVIFIILLGLSIWKFDEFDDFLVVFGAGFSTFAIIIIIIALSINISCIVDSRNIDKRISLYKKQNAEIEEKIEAVVKGYMNYEGETFKDLKSDSYVSMVSLYPELKSDSLVQEQIKLYTKNNKKITELKESKLDVTINKWWVYFGK